MNIYRPPSSSISTFFEHFQSLLEEIHLIRENLAIIGDFNLHLETTYSNSKTFHSLTNSFDLIQKVNFPTHIHEHTLDQVLTKSNNDNISNIHTTDGFSDHLSVSFTLNFLTLRFQNNATVSFRKYHKIDKEKMKADLLASELINNPSKEPDTLYKQYHSTLSTLIDKRAPLHTKHTKAKYIPRWVNDIVIAVKETKRLFERIWRRDKSTFNRSRYMQKVHQYNRICMQAKSQFLKAKIQDNHNNPQKLWRVLGNVLHRLPAKILPSIKPPQLLDDRFVEFFIEKIEKIRSTFSDSPPPMFSTFSTVTEDQVTKVITNSPSKSCSLDPWPTFLVLDYLDILITPITSIINASLEQGKCPNFFKQAHVTPILKKPSLDKEVFKNYRNVSNLNFISKILERVVAVQLQTHLDEAGLMTAFQSAYRKHHSTESALLNIQNDILLDMAKGSVTALSLLDLSTAFDTIDHTILLDRLNVYYGLSELALGWFKSYLSGRTHSVKVGSTLSHPAALHYGVPQGSVLGPILFSLYTNPIGSIIHSHSSINYHFYADDTQLYITLSPENFSHSIQKLKNCLNDIQNFMFAIKLKLNPDKTEFILIGSRKNRNQLLPHFPINILGNQVSPAQSVRNLGVVFDSNFTFSNHVS